MLKEAKKALLVTVSNFDSEIAHLLMSGANDLEIAGVVLPGTVSFAATSQGMQDNSNLEDALCIRAIITYVRMHFQSPPDYDRLEASYETQKTQLMHATGYTDYEDGDGE